MSALQSKKRSLLFLLLIGILISWGVYECKHYYSKWSDYRNSPWAYSQHENTKLLVGKWQGVYKDPDQVQKTITLEIFVPRTDEERRSKASKRWKRSSYSSRYKNSFDGRATVNSRLGREEYEIYGAVEKDDFHKLHFNFRTADGKKPVLPNFGLLFAKNGSWADDTLTISFRFAYYKTDGSSYSSSADPRFEKVVTTTLKRTI
jgi:hypothetical protein